MRGFRIKFRSEEIVVTPDFRSSVTIFYSSSNGYELSVAGIKGYSIKFFQNIHIFIVTQRGK